MTPSRLFLMLAIVSLAAIPFLTRQSRPTLPPALRDSRTRAANQCSHQDHYLQQASTPTGSILRKIITRAMDRQLKLQQTRQLSRSTTSHAFKSLNTGKSLTPSFFQLSGHRST